MHVSAHHALMLSHITALHGQNTYSQNTKKQQVPCLNRVPALVVWVHRRNSEIWMCGIRRAAGNSQIFVNIRGNAEVSKFRVFFFFLSNSRSTVSGPDCGDMEAFFPMAWFGFKQRLSRVIRLSVFYRGKIRPCRCVSRYGSTSSIFWQAIANLS